MAKKIINDRSNSYKDKMKSSDYSVVKVNGKEITVAEYYKDPSKYNSIPLNADYIKECEEHLEKSIETKKKLHIDPLTIKTIF